jgi:xylan 1,4-beta-xylosidase
MIKSLKLIAVFFTSACLASSALATTYTINVNGATKQGAVPHFWSRCVGTGGAQLCTDANWKKAAKIGVEEAGFQAFRGHLILSASNPISWSGSGTPTYNWTEFDKIYDILVDTLKTVPVVELSAMPSALQSNGLWSPPKDYSVWGNMIKELVNHCITRYGKENVEKWIWEVWNEWDYKGFWGDYGGDESEYYQLYKYAAEGAKSADSLIKIGGPASSMSSNVQPFWNYCKDNSVKVDLLSNHCYGQSGTTISKPTGIRDDNRTRSNVIKNTGKTLLSLNTEFNSSYSGQGGSTSDFCISMDSHVNAPFVVKCVKLILDDASTYQLPDVLSYWAISDVFDEGSWYSNNSYKFFGQVFGLINQHGIRKATFNAFKMLNMVGATRISLTGGTGDNDGVDGFATLSSDSSQVAIMVYNFYNTLSGQTAIDSVNLSVNNLPFSNGSSIEIRHYRVDSLHSNPYGVWQRMKKPLSTNSAAMDSLTAASKLAMLDSTTISYTGVAYTKGFSLPRQAVSLLLFKNKSSAGIAPKGQAIKDNCAFSLNGTVLHVSGANKSSTKIAIYSLDGKNVNYLRIGNEYCDLRQYLPNGVFLVRALGSGSNIIRKIVIGK